jgi:hypothetical protein
VRTLIAPRGEVMAKVGCLTWADARAIVMALDFAYGDDDGSLDWGTLRATDAEYARGKRLWRELTSAGRKTLERKPRRRP